MEITVDQADQESLVRFGQEAISLLKSGDFNSLASRYGYALCFGREPAKAIEEDIAACRTSETRTQGSFDAGITVTYFKPNDTHLYAAVECTTHLADGMPILMNLIVTYKGVQRYIALEGITAL